MCDVFMTVDSELNLPVTILTCKKSPSWTVPSIAT